MERVCIKVYRKKSNTEILNNPITIEPAQKDSKVADANLMKLEPRVRETTYLSKLRVHGVGARG